MLGIAPLSTVPLSSGPSAAETAEPVNFENFSVAALAGLFDSSAQEITISSLDSARFSEAPFLLTWWNFTDFPDPSEDPDREIVKVTAKVDATTFRVLRGQERTAAKNHNTQGKTYKVVAAPTADFLNGIQTDFEFRSGAGSPEGAVQGDTGDLYMNTSGGPGRTQFVKEAGSGNALGWSPVDSIPVGSLIPYAGPAAPSGWLLCDGSEASRTTFGDLFSVIGTTYGVGNGTTTFNLPDLRGRHPLGLDNMGGTSADRVTAAAADTLGGAAGAEDHLLIADESGLPGHNHTQNPHTHVQDAHTHVQDAHNHTQDAHNHTQDAHNHTQDAHDHASQQNGFLVSVAAGGTGALAAGTTVQVDANTATKTATNQAATATNQAATATNQAATATNQSTTPTNQSETATNNAVAAASASQAHNNMAPYLALNFLIRT